MEIFVEFTLIDELGMLSVDRFDFDGYFLIGFSINGLVDYTERPLSYLFDDFIFISHLRRCLHYNYYYSIDNSLIKSFRIQNY
jgi:hypothetical protein